MFNLILGILSSALITILMRLSEKYRKNHQSMLAMNYLMCTALAWMACGTVNVLAPTEGMGAAVGLGAVSGVLYLVSFMMLQWNISKNGVVLSSMFMKLGVVVPTVMAMLFFGESPSIAQIAGCLAAVGAICMMQGGGKGEIASMAGLIALLLTGGITDSMAKVYKAVGSEALNDSYLLFTFAVAMLLCVALCIVKKQRLTVMDALFGLAIGVPNYFSAKFLLKSLESVPAVVAYPTYSVGTIVVVTTAGILLFKEKLSKRKIAALAVILIALALLNL